MSDKQFLSMTGKPAMRETLCEHVHQNHSIERRNSQHFVDGLVNELRCRIRHFLPKVSSSVNISSRHLTHFDCALTPQPCQQLLPVQVGLGQKHGQFHPRFFHVISVIQEQVFHILKHAGRKQLFWDTR